MRFVTAVALLISLSVSAPALADPKPTDGMVTDDCALARKAGKTCVLEVPAEEVGGKVPTADEIAIRVLRFTRPGSLIRVRQDFIPEIVKAADDL
jgi:hypothetical protein